MSNPFDAILAELRERAIYVRLVPSGANGPVVSIEETINLLDNLKKSYEAYLEFSYLSMFSDENKINLKFLRTLKEDAELQLVNLEFKSLAVACAPNFITYGAAIDEELFRDKNPITFKQTTFENFKSDVVFFDYTDLSAAVKLQSKFNSYDYGKIYEPFFKLSDDSAHGKLLEFGTGSFSAMKRFSAPRPAVRERLVTIQQRDSIKSVLNTAVALVEYAEGPKRLRTKVLELFDSETKPTVNIEFIKVMDMITPLKYPLSCSINIDEGMYSISQPQLSIIAYGETLEFALEAFQDELEFIYQEYNLYDEKELSSEVVKIRNYLNFHVNHE